MYWGFFYAYQRFLVILLDCVILALHTAYKNSLSSYQMVGFRDPRVIKFGQTVVETWDVLPDSMWEVSISPSSAEAGLPAWWAAWPPLQPEPSPRLPRESPVPFQSHGSHVACFPPLSSPLTLAWSDVGITKAAEWYSIWTNAQQCNHLLTYARSTLTHTTIKTFTSIILVLEWIQILETHNCSKFLL